MTDGYPEVPSSVYGAAAAAIEATEMLPRYHLDDDVPIDLKDDECTEEECTQHHVLLASRRQIASIVHDAIRRAQMDLLADASDYFISSDHLKIYESRGRDGAMSERKVAYVGELPDWMVDDIMREVWADQGAPCDCTECIYELAGTVYKPEGVRLWMESPNPMLDGCKPLDLIQIGEHKRVAQVLEMLTSGAYA